MLKPIHILPLLLLQLIAASCSSKATDEPAPAPPDPVEEPQYLMTFSPDSDAPESRDDASDAVADKLGRQFAVFTQKTTPSSTTEYVMAKDPSGSSPYLVDYSPATGWSYTASDQYLKYWDLSARSYSFYAVANYSSPSFSHSFAGGKCTFTGLSAADPYAASILECSYKRDGMAMADYDLLADDPGAVFYTPAASDGVPAYADIVPLPFHYLLSQVQFKIYNKSPQSGLSISILHAEIRIYGDKGFYTAADYTNPDFAYSGSQSYTFVDTDYTDAYIKSNKKNAYTLYSSSVIPQTLTGVTAHVVVTTDVGTLTGTVTLNPGWDRGKIYTYYLYTEYTEDLILVSEVDIDPWTPTSPPIDKTQTNW